jgi:hypothetical protein
MKVLHVINGVGTGGAVFVDRQLPPCDQADGAEVRAEFGATRRRRPRIRFQQGTPSAVSSALMAIAVALAEPLFSGINDVVSLLTRTRKSCPIRVPKNLATEN